MTTGTLHIKPLTHKQRKNCNREPPLKHYIGRDFNQYRTKPLLIPVEVANINRNTAGKKQKAKLAAVEDDHKASIATRNHPASILRTSTSGRHRPVSYPDGPMTARYRFT